MPRRKSALPIPAYGLHRATGQARVVIHGRTAYLGRHDSPGSWEKYRRLIAESVDRGKHDLHKIGMFAANEDWEGRRATCLTIKIYRPSSQ